MSTYAQLEDLEAWAGEPIDPAHASQMQEWLNEAEILLEVVGGKLADRIDAELTDTDRVKKAVVGMVRRAVANRAASVAILSAASSTGEERKAVRAGVLVTRRERTLIGMTGSAGSIDLSDGDPQIWRPLRPPFFPPPDRYGLPRV